MLIGLFSHVLTFQVSNGLAGNSLFCKNREFEMFDQGIALGRTGN